MEKKEELLFQSEKRVFFTDAKIFLKKQYKYLIIKNYVVIIYLNKYNYIYKLK